MKPILFGIALILALAAAYFLLKSSLPSPVAFRDIDLNADLAALKNLEKNPDYGLTITPPSGKAESVIGYIGAVAVKETDPTTGESKWSFLGEFRPSRSEIEVVPTEEKLYEGIVTSGLKAGGQFTTFTSDLSVDEAAELRVVNDLVLGYRDNSQIPWDRLRRIPIEPAREYWFVDSAVLTTTSYRKFQKLENKNEIAGVAFKANGQMYASTEGFLSQRRLSLRIFNLRYLKPAQGGAAQPIGELLELDELSEKDAQKLLDLLRRASLDQAPSQFPPISRHNGIGTPRIPQIASEYVIAVQPLRQEQPNGCWATTAAIMFGWKHQRSMSVTGFLEEFAPDWLDRYQQDDGLSVDEAIHFVERIGLSFEYGQSYLPEGVERLLAAHGPLWFTVGTEGGYNTPANLVVGIRRTADLTYVSYVDPGDGRLYDEPYGAFMRRYEHPALLYNRKFMKEMTSGEVIPLHVVRFDEPNEMSVSLERTGVKAALITRLHQGFVPTHPIDFATSPFTPSNRLTASGTSRERRASNGWKTRSFAKIYERASDL